MREVQLNGFIEEEAWYDDDISPDTLHDALYAEDADPNEDVTIVLNSYGGVCNAAPALPGRDVCLSCLKEMASGGSDTDNDETPTVVDESTIGLNSVSTMDEIIPQIHEDIPETEFGDIESELSLESVIEDEENEDDDDEEEKEEEDEL